MDSQVLTRTALPATWLHDSGTASAPATLAVPLNIDIPLGRIALFTLLSVADLCLTWVLLHFSGGLVYESNPIANSLLTHYGWAGIVIFKLSDILLVASIVLVLAIFQPRAARRVVTLAACIVGCVTLYSVYLIIFFVG